MRYAEVSTDFNVSNVYGKDTESQPSFCRWSPPKTCIFDQVHATRAWIYVIEARSAKGLPRGCTVNNRIWGRYARMKIAIGHEFDRLMADG